MEVMLTDPPGLFVYGTLQGVISEQDAHYPHIVIEMNVTGRNPAKVTLDQADLSTIVRLVRASKVEKLRDAIR
jgi:hypothetical protein